MRAVKSIAARGTSVICTIHQPSETIFGMFTHLLLLKKGNETAHTYSLNKSLMFRFPLCRWIYNLLWTHW